MAEESDDLPNFVIRQIPGRHRRVADAVVDVGEDLTVRQRREQLAKGRRARIDMLADGRVAASVEIVTDRAFLLKRRSAGGDGRFVRLQRIDARRGLGRHAVSEQPGRDFHLDRGRRRARARETGERETIESGGAHDEQEKHSGKGDQEASTHCVLLPARRPDAGTWSYCSTTATVLSAAPSPCASLIASSFAQK